MEITLNMLIEWTSDESNRQSAFVERIVSVSPTSEIVFAINVFAKTGFPVCRLRDDIVFAYETGDLRILTVDPYAVINMMEEDIPRNQRKLRDDAWKLVEEVWEEAGNGIYEKSARGKAVAKVAAKYEKHVRVIYSHLRKCWQRGLNKNALLPKFSKCGGKGKKRTAEAACATKLGRPSSLSKTTGKSIGIRITSRHEKLFEKGIKKFYESRDKHSLSAAYQKTLDAHFNIGYQPVDDIQVPILPAAAELPTFKQFRYWYETKFRDKKREFIARHGENKFNLERRELTNSVNSLASGPGSVYMIDATIADIYLVSWFYRFRIIGRPIVYLILDVFSRMIVGFSVSLEGPSWEVARLALDNMVADKVKVCAEYGITIQPEEWNCHHLPEAIFADRGEFEGYNADNLVANLGIRIHNTAPKRGDNKSIVERHFGIVNEKFLHFTPGAVVERAYGEKPHALDAKLTVYDFSKLLITHILDHNANQELSYYRPDEHQIADQVPLRPAALWNWGITNRSGHLHVMSRDIVRLSFLPSKEISLSRHGIHFYKDIYYLRPNEISFGAKGKIKVHYDPNCLDVIYIPLADGQNAVVCPLTPACMLYRGRTFQEVEDMFALRNQTAENNRTQKLQSKATFNARAKAISSEATKLTEDAIAAGEVQSDHARLQGIRLNRKQEAAAERSQKAWDLLNKGEINTLLPAPINSSEFSDEDEDEDEYVTKPRNTDLIRSILDKNQDKGVQTTYEKQ